MAVTVAPNLAITPDPRQREAIEHVNGPMLVIAGAGAGKTTVLTQRVAHLIRAGHARPDQILALTYTDNAADEMKNRVRAELKGANLDGLQVSTFHAWCNSLLQRRGRSFGVLDDKDLWVYLRRNIRELKLKYFVRAANVSQFLDDLLDFMRRCQDELVRPEDYAAYVARLERGEIPLPRVAKSKKQAELEDQEILERSQEIARVFTTVEKMLAEKNLGTFGHMITRAWQALNGDAALLEQERSRARFLLVDEFQDANFAQIEMLTKLAGSEANVSAVGDPDQAIYRFRGASSEAFTLFMKAMPEAKLVVLENNRRSLSPILRCAFGIVNENPPVFAKKSVSFQRAPLESDREKEAVLRGEPITAPPVEIVTWSDREVEAADLAYQIQKRRRAERCSWSDFAVLYRQHSHREELVRELTEHAVPFSIEGLDVLDTPEVRDALAALTAAVNPKDAASLFRVAAFPPFDIDPQKLRSGMQAVRRQEMDLRRVLEKLPNGPAVLESVNQVHTEVEKEGVTASEALRLIMRQFDMAASVPLDAFLNFVDMWQRKPLVEAGTAAEFLEFLEYFRQARGAIALPSSTTDGVRLLSAHAAKGLEFRHVAIIRGSSTSFPCSYREPLVAMPPELRHSESLHDDKTLNEQEERRLFYVAMTRARDTLSIFAKQGTGTDQTPTKFLREFMRDTGYRKFWRHRSAVAVQDTLFAEEESYAVPRSNVAAWLWMDPSASFVTGLSATAIEIYEECPLRFKLEREWNLPREVPASLHYGAAMHRVLRTFYDAYRFGREIGDDALIEMFRADLVAAGIPDRYQYELYLRQGIEQLKQFLSVAHAQPMPGVLETEQRFELQVGAARLAGRVDRIDQVSSETVAVIDYKTGKPKSQEDADKSLQLSLYALAAKEVWGRRAELLIFQNLENNTMVCTTRTDSELEDAKRRVEDAAEKIARGLFNAKYGYHCNLCPYRNLCPATEKIVSLPQKKSAMRAN
jgi:superfamily I DNA/RNA helicase/CRISPR/Cas system-associated exonuclease Cas4 (RecB family)